MTRKQPVPPFPTGVSAHKKCSTCNEWYHIYQFPLVDRKADKRGRVCLGCVAKAKEERLTRIRPN